MLGRGEKAYFDEGNENRAKELIEPYILEPTHQAPGNGDGTMRIILIFCLTLFFVSPAHAAAPTKAPKAPPVNVNIRTAGDLADACTAIPNSQTSLARLNFCNGFAQGVLQTERQNLSGTKVCIPSPSPKRSETMKEFASWVRADASRRDDVASVAFLRFMAGRFPCQ
jgi:hypothetical protein